jgi:SepF-like predicted cell division protein (DUF552 family)
MICSESVLLNNIDKIHTTPLGLIRIAKNIQQNEHDIIGWCIKKITDKKSIITRNGKNWYVEIDGYEITINAYSYTIITVHVIKKNWM